MNEPVWLSADLVMAFHDEHIRAFGGLAGLRDRDALCHALAQAPLRFGEGETNLATLAATYAVALANCHPFLDGNKRTVLLAIMTFLGLNGIVLLAPEAEAAALMRDLYTDEIGETELVRWLNEHWPAA
jgi:death on curing protein